MRALLVDDDPNIRAIVRRVLTRQFESLQVVDCTDGVQALEELSRGEYDLVLLDVSMPFMDGLDAAEHPPLAGHCEGSRHHALAQLNRMNRLQDEVVDSNPHRRANRSSTP